MSALRIASRDAAFPSAHRSAMKDCDRLIPATDRPYMAEHKQAVVVGALGVIGRYIVERLSREDGWSVIGLSRREAAAAPRYCHIAVDLLDRDDVTAKLAGLTEATHVFYAAFQPAVGAAAAYASN